MSGSLLSFFDAILIFTFKNVLLIKYRLKYTVIVNRLTVKHQMYDFFKRLIKDISSKGSLNLN